MKKKNCPACSVSSSISDASGGVNLVCDVVVSLSTEEVTLADAYTYDIAINSGVTGISPSRGGTGGGTDLTITGTGLDRAGFVVYLLLWFLNICILQIFYKRQAGTVGRASVYNGDSLLGNFDKRVCAASTDTA